MNRRPESFDLVAALYDRARPSYPPQLLDDLWSLAELQPGGRVLEIGAGTGQMTAPLVARGLDVTALEPGAHLAEIVRRKLPAIDVVECRFEDYVLPSEPFDLLISATAFHWVDPDVRIAKSRAALRAGGHLAIVETHWGVGREPDAFSLACQPCFERWDPEVKPGFVPPIIAELATSWPELDEAPGFETVEHRFYEQINSYDTRSYLDLNRTWSNVLGLDETRRQGLLDCVGELIDQRFFGRIERCDLRGVWLARAVEPSSP